MIKHTSNAFNYNKLRMQFVNVARVRHITLLVYPVVPEGMAAEAIF